ncbi:MAG: PDZ domain-containing protein [Actinobacteria bacterium]|nr:PDZ domain-containing protein [Actinomycetota bacterium]
MGAHHSLGIHTKGDRDLRVTEVIKGGLAEELGIQRKDLMLRIQGQPVESTLDVRRGLIGCEDGEWFEVVVRRNGQELTLRAELVEESYLGGGGTSPTRGKIVVSTLHVIPGYHVTSFVGMVSGIGSRSGADALTKMSAAYRDAEASLIEQAAGIGANAVLGVQGQATGAGTGGILGDAIAYSLFGSAVVIERDTRKSAAE